MQVTEYWAPRPARPSLALAAKLAQLEDTGEQDWHLVVMAVCSVVVLIIRELVLVTCWSPPNLVSTFLHFTVLSRCAAG